MARITTRTITAAPVAGTAINFGDVDTEHPIQLILYPGRTGDVRLQWSSGAKDTEGGEYLLIPQSAGGVDPLVLLYDRRGMAPKFIAADAGTVNCRYSVSINHSGLLPNLAGRS